MLWISPTDVTGNNYSFTVACFTSSGTLDNTFSGDGLAINTIGASSDTEASGITVYRSGANAGKVLAVGKDAATGFFALIRYNSDGSL